MIPFVNDQTGLRDYRPAPVSSGQASRCWFWVLLLVCLMVGLFFAVTVRADEACIALQVRPRVMISRQDIDVQLRIAPHVDHRRYTMAWTSEDGSAGSSGAGLDGDQARRLYTVSLPNQPASHYAFTASVFDGTGHLLGVSRASILGP